MCNVNPVFTIPESVIVSGITYDVVEKDVVVIGDSSNYAGSVDYGQCEIQILKEQNIQRKNETFLHELIHAVLFEAGYREEHDEDIVDDIARGLYQVLKDNFFYKLYLEEEGEDVG